MATSPLGMHKTVVAQCNLIHNLLTQFYTLLKREKAGTIKAPAIALLSRQRVTKQLLDFDFCTSFFKFFSQSFCFFFRNTFFKNERNAFNSIFSFFQT